MSYINHLHHNSIARLATIVLLLLGVATANSQSPGRPRFSLALGSAVGYGESRDCGTSPRPYENLSIGQGVAFYVETVEWNFKGGIAISGMLNMPKVKYLLKNGSYSGYAGSFEIGLSALRRVWQNGEATWSVFVGGGLSNYTYVGYSPQYMNASFSLSDLFQPDFRFRVQYDLPNSNTLVVMPGWLSAYASLSLSPVGLAYRPGYSFIDNYTDGRETGDYIFTTYRVGVAWLPCVASELGVRFNLRSGNRISLAYCWSYRSSHGTGYWTFDEARHQLMVDFVFLLKRN